MLCFRNRRRVILGQRVVESGRERRGPTGSGGHRRRGPEEQTVLVQPERRRQRRFRKRFVRHDPSECLLFLYMRLSRCPTPYLQ